MRKLTYLIVPNEGNYYHVEFITDREPKWTEEQFLRHRRGYKMEMLSDEETKEKIPTSREVKLG